MENNQVSAQGDQISSSRAISPLSRLRALLRGMRPQQWVKNAFVLAPLIFARHLGDASFLLQSLSAFAIFCAISSAVYLLNDLFDVASDRIHPIKRLRPIASGLLPLPLAWTACALLALSSLSAALAFNTPLAIVIASYFAMNVAYSTRLKHVPFIDVSIIATGFLFRLLAGAYATNIPVSIWIVSCTFLLALYLALGKRQHELRNIKPGEQRRVLERYNQKHVQVAMLITGALTLLTYSAYTLSPDTQERFAFSWPRFALTIPFTALGLSRFWSLTHLPHILSSPTDAMLKDPPFLLNALAWCTSVILLVYAFN